MDTSAPTREQRRAKVLQQKRPLALVVAGALCLALMSCDRPRESATPTPTSGDGSSCPEAFAAAQSALTAALETKVPWTGPTTGPPAADTKTVVYIAQTMTNPGVAGVAKGAEDAAGAIGWNLVVIDGQGTPAGIQAAFGQALLLKPDALIVSGFDPTLAGSELERANAAGIPVVGWHAVDAPGPSENPRLFTNITTHVDDVARISAQWIIERSGGTAAVVVFSDASIPFAAHKAQLIKDGLATCPGVEVLATEDIPIADASAITPPRVGSLLARFGEKWTYSVAINDLYFADAAPALKAGGKSGGGAPFNIGAGDGDPTAFQRVRDRQFQAATVPEPLLEQGWQAIDELNRAFGGWPASGYVPPVHLTTQANVGNASYWEPENGYRAEYQRIWGR